MDSLELKNDALYGLWQCDVTNLTHDEMWRNGDYAAVHSTKDDGQKSQYGAGQNDVVHVGAGHLDVSIGETVINNNLSKHNSKQNMG